RSAEKELPPDRLAAAVERELRVDDVDVSPEKALGDRSARLRHLQVAGQSARARDVHRHPRLVEELPGTGSIHDEGSRKTDRVGSEGRRAGGSRGAIFAVVQIDKAGDE